MYDEKIFVGVANVEEDFCITTTKKIKGTYFEFHFVKGQTIPIYKNNVEEKSRRDTKNINNTKFCSKSKRIQ